MRWRLQSHSPRRPEQLLGNKLNAMSVYGDARYRCISSCLITIQPCHCERAFSASEAISPPQETASGQRPPLAVTFQAQAE
jgi:hypothetical protein